MIGPSIDGMLLASHSCGFAFELDSATSENSEEQFDKWTVQTKSGSKYIVARASDPNVTAIHPAARECAEQMLDLMCMKHDTQSAILHGNESYLEAAKELESEQYRCTYHARGHHVRMGGTATIEIRRKDGTIERPTGTKINWHPSLRFYRRSRSSDDLLDAGRNIMLALECILSEIRPQDEAEGEVKWIKAVLGEPHVEEVARKIWGPRVTAGNVYRDIWKEFRHAFSHAKQNHRYPYFLPFNSEETSDLHKKLETATALYRGVMEKPHRSPFPYGVTTPRGRDLAIDAIVANCVPHATFKNGLRVLGTVDVVKLGPGERIMRSVINAEATADDPLISVAMVAESGSPIMSPWCPKGELRLANVREFELCRSFSLTDVGDPLATYPLE